MSFIRALHPYGAGAPVKGQRDASSPSCAGGSAEGGSTTAARPRSRSKSSAGYSPTGKAPVENSKELHPRRRRRRSLSLEGHHERRSC